MSYHPPTHFGRYELIGQLAVGGMAEIHLARLAGEAGFEKLVVVKRLLPELVASKAYVAMFLDEGKLAAKLSHPNVCEVHELGREGAEYFLVMPFLDGVPATDFIARPRQHDRSAQLRVAAGIVVQACAGLHHAHELRAGDGELLGVVHRDVSPSNLFVTTAGVVKVLDFGVAKVRGAAATEVGTIKGKTQYMAPEQLLGEPLDRRCDVFAMGTVLWELATHQRLFERDSDYLTARAILEEPIARADAVDPAVPAGLADVIARALERRRDDRFASARELGKAIEDAMPCASADAIGDALARWHGEELSAVRTRQRRVVDAARSRATEVTTVHQPRRSRWGWALGGGAVIGAAIVAVGAGTRRETHTTVRDAAVVSDAAIDASVVTVEIDAGVAPVKITRPAPAEPGFVSIDSTPFATVYVDGKRIGVTPMLRRALPAGTHLVRAVLEDGRSRELRVEITSGKLAKPIVLTWR